MEKSQEAQTMLTQMISARPDPPFTKSWIICLIITPEAVGIIWQCPKIGTTPVHCPHASLCV